MNIVIFEDDTDFADILEKYICHYTHHPSVLRTDSLQGLERYIQHVFTPTLYFLDIIFDHAPEKAQGFLAAKAIIEKNADDLFVFMTAYPSQIIGQTYWQIQAFHTLLKSQKTLQEQVQHTIDLAKSYFDKHCLVISDRNQNLLIPFRNICYIESVKYTRKCRIVTTQGEFLMNVTPILLFNYLDKRFVYACKGCIVNRDNIRCIDKVKKIIVFQDHISCYFTNLYALKGGLL